MTTYLRLIEATFQCIVVFQLWGEGPVRYVVIMEHFWNYISIYYSDLENVGILGKENMLLNMLINLVYEKLDA